MRRGNPLIYSAAVEFCIWLRVLPRCRASRASLLRKLTQGGRCMLVCGLSRERRLLRTDVGPGASGDREAGPMPVRMDAERRLLHRHAQALRPHHTDSG